jgi:hypothetical protein
MNKQIQKLALESGLDYDPFVLDDAEKFAKLIVEECAKAILNNQLETPDPEDPNNPFYLGWVRGCVDAAHVIKDQFGLDN